MDDNLKRLLNTLGMARRAGELTVGQDHVFDKFREHVKLLVILANDCSGTVLRKTKAAVERGEAHAIVLKEADRSVLGSFIGAQTAQIAALPAESGFAAKVLSLQDRSDAHE